jgi:hypothetical protein
VAPLLKQLGFRATFFITQNMSWRVAGCNRMCLTAPYKLGRPCR